MNTNLRHKKIGVLQNKTTQILALLTFEEIKSLDKWLSSPWCNSNKKILSLFNLLKKHYPTFEHSSLAKPNLFKKLYPGKVFDDKWMRNLLSGLTKEAERFLQHQRLMKDDQLGKKMLIEEYQERNQLVKFEKKTFELIRELEAKPNKDLQDLYDLNFLFEKLYREPSSVDRQHPGTDWLTKANFWLDQFYALAKARNLMEFSERQIIFGEEYNLEPLVNYLAKISSDSSVENAPAAIALYHQIYKHRSEDDPQIIEATIATFRDQKSQMGRKDQTICLLLLLNRVIRIHAKGNRLMELKVLNLYQFGLENDLLFVHDKLTEGTFTNVVVVASYQKEYEFAKIFIENNYSRLADHLQEDGKNWGMAFVSYTNKGKIDKELEMVLSQRKKDPTTFYLRSKNLLLNLYNQQVGVFCKYF